MRAFQNKNKRSQSIPVDGGPLTSAKTVEFLGGGFLCNPSVEPETKEAFVFPNNDDSKAVKIFRMLSFEN